MPWGTRVTSFPRQCVFFGTSNDKSFLRDHTGNRRFWPVETHKIKPIKNIFSDLDNTEVDQIWAEAMLLYKNCESLFLLPALEEKAIDIQSEHTETDERGGLIKEFLDMALPADWNDLNIQDRRFYKNNNDEISSKGIKPRDKVCVAEIWCELLNGDVVSMTSQNTKTLHQIMQNMPGWEKVKNNRWFYPYGYQRSYVRKPDKT